jgi:hypothetical protein
MLAQAADLEAQADRIERQFKTSAVMGHRPMAINDPGLMKTGPTYAPRSAVER